MKATRLRSLLVVSALSLALAPLTACKGKTADAAAGVKEEPAVEVKTEAVTSIEVPRTLRLTGTLRGDRETDLAANANGRVLSTTVERGEQIKPGQVLAKLDTRALALSAADARAQVESIRAQEQQAKGECEKYEQLKARGAISDLEYQQKVTQCRTLPLNVQAASARAALAAQNVGDGVIRAPFAGVVTERFVEVGQYVRQDSRVVTIVSADPLRLQITVPESQVASVKEGASVTFTVAAYPDRRFEGTVRFVSGALRSTTRDLVAEAMVPNPERLLIPGMFADVALTVGSQKAASVPARAMREADEQSRVFVVTAGRLEERIVALGPKSSLR
ncbi:MAG: putative Co/Zn/Cd efflux system rane fusion protein [Polyangiaceae bacterium]|nr:putative Co/Zn/Cd efflux system rane fusion protein [Polyangiaceae bacterium]